MSIGAHLLAQLKPMLARSWLFEVVDKQTGKIQESFTLVLPPQRINIKEKQRVSVTKTFGNIFVDDYGSDNLEITISGISGTAHVFPTFRSQGISTGIATTYQKGATTAAITSVLGYTGRSAFYTFRDAIMRYKDSQYYDQYALRVYDLYDEQSYKCILLEFDLDRNGDKPFYYPFTISLMVEERLNSKYFMPWVVDFSGNINAAMDVISSAIAVVEDLFAMVEKVVNSIAVIKANLEAMERRIVSLKDRALDTSLECRVLCGTTFGCCCQCCFACSSAGFDTYQPGRRRHRR
jgi:hypothetical protein